jgi:ABC-type transport system involved in multi-copper enzyme maturation permease subunit
MNIQVVKRLVWKDWYLSRTVIIAGLAAGIVTIAAVVAAHGTQLAVILGMIMMVTILIGAGAMLMVGISDERKLQTLPFVMTLPISYKEYTASKIVGSLLIFLVLWSALVAAMVLSILLLPGFPHGLIPFVVIMSVEILMSTCLITAVAVTTESHGWTVGISQVGALSLNLIGWSIVRFPEIGGTLRSPAVHWSTTATVLILVEIGIIAVMLAAAFLVQSHKRDFV